MIRVLSGFVVTLSAYPAISLVAKATVALAAGLIGAWFARRSRAAVRHALLASVFSVLLALPIVSLVATPVPIAVPVAKGDSSIWPLFDNVPAPSSGEPEAERSSAIPAKSGWSLFPLATMLLYGWFIGTVLFMIPIVRGLLQIRSLRRFGLPWRHAQGARRRVEILLHESLPGPMTCGVLHPVIILPADAQRWNKQDLERALIHELEHVRRYDWPIHCLARVACAAYWFHPLVWIAWRRLKLEAERSCDDAVLRSSEATAYADQLVGLARRRSVVGKSPVLAMAGRSDLAARVGALLDGSQRRGPVGALLVAAACIVAAAIVLTMSPLRMVAAQSQVAPAPMPIQVAQVQQPPVSGEPRSQPATKPKFEVASIRPNVSGGQGSRFTPTSGRIDAENVPVDLIIRAAFGIQSFQIVGAPGWINSDRFDVVAKADGTSTVNQMLEMLQSLLEDRFGLKFHRETKELPVYELIVAKTSFKLHESTCTVRDPLAPETPPVAGQEPTSYCDGMRGGTKGKRTVMDGQGIGIGMLLRWLSQMLGRPVIDRTGLAGRYDFHLEFTSEQLLTGPAGPLSPAEPGSAPPSAEISGPSVFTAFQQQLGLKLETGKGPSEVLVIDHIERPSEN